MLLGRCTKQYSVLFSWRHRFPTPSRREAGVNGAHGDIPEESDHSITTTPATLAM